MKSCTYWIFFPLKYQYIFVHIKDFLFASILMTKSDWCCLISVICTAHSHKLQQQPLKETSIFFYYCPAHHYVFLLLESPARWGTKTPDRSTSWTALIGWYHRTTAASSWGINKVSVWSCHALFSFCPEIGCRLLNIKNNDWEEQWALEIDLDGRNSEAIKTS